jgi:hypothetical protein
MSKFDKKVLKYVAAHQEDDLDVDDIAIGLNLDEDDVRDTLDSLQDQGKVEGSPRNGKTYWRLSTLENDPVEDIKQVSIQNAPDFVAIDFEQAIEEQGRKPLQAAEIEKIGPEEIEKNQVLPTPKSVTYVSDAEDDMDMNFSSKIVNSPVVWIAIAIVVSVVISTIISMMIAGGPQKSFSDSIQALERKSNETDAKLDKRIAEITALVNVLNDKLPARQQHKTDQNRAARPSRSQHRIHASTTPSSTDESTTSTTSGLSGSDQSPPPSSSGNDDNSGIAPTPPASTEGTGESGK